MPARFVPFPVNICGLDELAGFDAVTDVLSILDPGYPEPDDFSRYGAHRRLELRFHDIIEERADEIAPTVDDVQRILRFGRDLMARPDHCGHLLVHCHAGISRSTAALTMVLAQARPDRPAAEAVAAVVAVRAKAWPNLRMIELADAELGRGGELVAAVRARHRAYAAERPDLVVFMRENGRERELEGCS